MLTPAASIPAPQSFSNCAFGMSRALPSPGVSGAAPKTALEKKPDASGAASPPESMRFVLTGEFTSIKYNLLNDAAEQLTGKEAVTRLIKSFGGMVSTAISG